MSTAKFGVTGALRTLRSLSGEQLFKIWTRDDKRSRWGSLSARSQQKWEELAVWVSEHAITEIDVTDRVITYQDPAADVRHRRIVSDDDIAGQAEEFLRHVDATPSLLEKAISGQTPQVKNEADLSSAIDALGPLITALLKKLFT